jgi:hypothetical protein
MKSLSPKLVILVGLISISTFKSNAEQVVIVKGSINNVANNGGQSLTNMSSVLGNGSGTLNVGEVSQITHVGGNVVNVSKGKDSRSEINLSTINNRK